jgi:hypothetical protein
MSRKDTTKRRHPGLTKEPEPEYSMESLSTHVLGIINHPLTPVALYDAVICFLTESVNLKSQGEGDSLFTRWLEDPPTVTAALNWASEQDAFSEGGVK